MPLAQRDPHTQSERLTSSTLGKRDRLSLFCESLGEP